MGATFLTIAVAVVGSLVGLSYKKPAFSRVMTFKVFNVVAIITALIYVYTLGKSFGYKESMEAVIDKTDLNKISVLDAALLGNFRVAGLYFLIAIAGLAIPYILSFTFEKELHKQPINEKDDKPL